MFGILKKAKSFGEAVVAHIIEDRLQNLPDEHYIHRLGICSTCEYKRENEWVCNECGCDLEVKARWPSQQCPKDKWLKIPLNVISSSPSTLEATKKPPEGGCGCGS